MKNLNYHFITDSGYSGYGMATKNMLESIKKIQYLSVKEVKAGTKGSPGAIDFFLRPPAFLQNGSKKRIGYFYWEADRLPRPWALALKTADEIWAPCKLVEEVCVQAGFRGPIKIIPTPHKPWNINFAGKIDIPNVNEETFKFYSVFQWHTRKGWKELLTSYINEFSKNDNVVLILKVNSIHGDAGAEEIKNNILELKTKIGKDSCPNIFLMNKFISYDQICALHEYADCYVSPHHGEGWGMPIHDAIFAKKIILTTRYGGVTDFLNDKNSFGINFTMGEVKDMSWNPAYEPGQLWAYPSEEDLSKKMRLIYDSKGSDMLKAKATNLSGIISTTSIDSVSAQISKILQSY